VLEDDVVSVHAGKDFALMRTHGGKVSWTIVSSLWQTPLPDNRLKLCDSQVWNTPAASYEIIIIAFYIIMIIVNSW